MIVGIDASNIRVGGGVTHLVELLRAANPELYGIRRVVVWGGTKTLSRIDERPSWLSKKHIPDLDKGLLVRMRWQRNCLDQVVKDEGCAILFVPGGVYSGAFSPVVTMSQNLLPFEWRELRRYGISWMALKMALLRKVQARTFRKAEGLIFLTEYAKTAVSAVVGPRNFDSQIIPLGVHERFFSKPRPTRSLSDYSFQNPLRLLYVSVVDVYKHQWNVADAVAALRKQGYPVVVDLVGPAVAASLRRLNSAIRRLDPEGEYIRFRGAVPYEELAELYRQCDVNIFASSCENMPNILIEAMASGLPIACSNRGPMSEVLGDAGVYFDPESPEQIASAVKCLVDSPELRAANSEKAYRLAHAYSWGRCAESTFGYLRRVLDRRSSDIHGGEIMKKGIWE